MCVCDVDLLVGRVDGWLDGWLIETDVCSFVYIHSISALKFSVPLFCNQCCSFIVVVVGSVDTHLSVSNMLVDQSSFSDIFAH